MAIKRRGWSEWFIYDLKKLVEAVRRMAKHEFYSVLSSAQRENLVETQQEVIDELERIKTLCKGGK